MIELKIENTYTQIVGDLPHNVNDEIDNTLSAEVVGAVFARRASPWWDGRKRFYKKEKRLLPTGMLTYVRNILDKYGIQYVHVDCRVPVKHSKSLPLRNVTLREYQQEAVDAAIKTQRGLVRAGTGAGKSNILSAILAKLNVKSLILIHKKDIFHQLIRTFERTLGVPIGRIGDGEFDPQRITVGMVQSMAHVFDPKVKALEKDDEVLKDKGDAIRQFLNEVECVLIDEAHHLAADTFWTLMQNAPNAYYRIGASATVFREDNMDMLLEGGTAQKFVDISSSQLIDWGYLVPPTIYLYDFEDDVRHVGKVPYARVYTESVVKSIKRNKLICGLALKAKADEHPVLIAVKQIEHGKILEKMLHEMDPSAIFVNGQSESEVRQQILKELGAGVNRIVIATDIYSEGVDMPALSCLINAKGAASGIDSLQLLGRVLRTSPNKTRAYVVDIQDGGKYLKEHSKERVDIYSTEPRYGLARVSRTEEVIFK